MMPVTIAKRFSIRSAAPIAIAAAVLGAIVIVLAAPRLRAQDVDTAAPVDEIPGLRAIDGYLQLSHDFTALNKDPAGVSVAAVFAAKDVLKANPEQAIRFFQQILPEVKNEVVGRAIKVELIDLYNEEHDSEKALSQIQDLITDAPPDAGAASK
jgi:hypothetical protein